MDLDYCFLYAGPMRYFLDQAFNALDKLVIKPKNTCKTNTFFNAKIKMSKHIFYDAKTCKIFYFILWFVF
jgi:hypothetical protein